MSFAETAALGATAGFTIYLGLPLGRLRTLSTRARVSLAMLSVGIVLTGVLLIMVGLILHTISRRFQELNYQLRTIPDEFHYTRTERPAPREISS